MAIDKTAPVRDYLEKVVVELVKGDLAVSIFVHQRETKHVLFVFGAVTEHVHDGCELRQVDLAVSVFVKHFEDSVSQIRVLLLAQQTHLRPELHFVHNSCRLYHFCNVEIGACRCLFEHLVELF